MEIMNNLMWCLLSLSLFFFKLLEVSHTQYLESNYEGSTSTLSIESSTSSCSGALEILLSSSALAAAESALLVFFLLLPVLLLPTSVADEEGLLAALVVPDLRSFAPEELLLSPLDEVFLVVETAAAVCCSNCCSCCSLLEAGALTRPLGSMPPPSCGAGCLLSLLNRYGKHPLGSGSGMKLRSRSGGRVWPSPKTLRSSNTFVSSISSCHAIVTAPVLKRA